MASLVGSLIFCTLLFIAYLIEGLLLVAIELSEENLLNVHIRSHLLLKELPLLDFLLQ